MFAKCAAMSIGAPARRTVLTLAMNALDVPVNRHEVVNCLHKNTCNPFFKSEEYRICLACGNRCGFTNFQQENTIHTIDPYNSVSEWNQLIFSIASNACRRYAI
jgi:hypothetical protein